MSWNTGTRWDERTDQAGVRRAVEPYTARIVYDDGAGTAKQVALSATWCTADEARAHIERRMPELYVERGLLGKRVQAAIRSETAGHTEYADIRDGKVINWR